MFTVVTGGINDAISLDVTALLEKGRIVGLATDTKQAESDDR